MAGGSSFLSTGGSRADSRRPSLRFAPLPIVLAVVTLAGFGHANRAPASAHVSAGGWSAATNLPLLGAGLGIQGISCPSASFCFAYDQVGHATIWNGKAWSALTRVAGGNYMTLDHAACASSSFCAAVVDNGSNVVPKFGEYAITWNGSSWTSPSSVYAGVGATVSCASSSFCVTAATSGSVRWNGSSWSSAGSISGVAESDLGDGESCAGKSLCVAVFSGHLVTGGVAVVWNGSSWSPAMKLSAWPVAVSCASSFCMVLDENGHYQQWNGKAWKTSSQPIDLDFNQGGGLFVSCSSKSFCLAVTHDGATAVWNGASWEREDSTAPWFRRDAVYAVGVSCASMSFCAAALSPGKVAVFDAAATGATGGKSPSAGKSSSKTALTSFARKIESDLSKLAAGRAQLVSTLSRAEACVLKPAAAASQMAAVTANREQALASLTELVPPNAQAAKIKALLKSVLSASIQSDRDYHDWLSDASVCPPPHNASFAAAGRADAQATSAKQRFVAAFNQLARSLHMRTWTASSI